MDENIDINANEAQESDDEYEAQAEKAAEASANDLLDFSNDEVQKAEQVVGDAMKAIDGKIEIELPIDGMDGQYNAPRAADEQVAGGARGDRLEAFEIEAGRQRRDEIGAQNRKGRICCRAKGLNVIFGLFTTIASVGAWIVASIALAEKARGGSSSDIDGLTPDQVTTLQAQIRRWWSVDDGAFWDQMSTFCDQWDTSLQGQVLMMDTVKSMGASVSPAFVWNKGDDKADAVQAIVDAYGSFEPAAKQSKSRIVYQTVKARQYDGKPLPRVIAADVAELALYQIINLERARQKKAQVA